MLSITLTLFGGLALKAQTEITTEKSTVYESGLMSALLIGINVGVVVLALYQMVLMFRKGCKGTNQQKLQRKVCVKAFSATLDRNQDTVVAICARYGGTEDHSKLLVKALKATAQALPIALESADNVSVIYQELTKIGSVEDALDTVDMLMRLARELLGDPHLTSLFHLYCARVGECLQSHLKSLGAPGDLVQLCAVVEQTLAQYMVENGIKRFVKDVLQLTSENDLATLETQLKALAGPSTGRIPALDQDPVVSDEAQGRGSGVSAEPPSVSSPSGLRLPSIARANPSPLPRLPSTIGSE